MSSYYAVERTGEYLEHYGVLGMRWGIRHDRRVKYAKKRYKTIKKETKKDRTLSDDQKSRKINSAREDWMNEREKAANRLYTFNSKEANRKIAREGSAKALAKTSLMGSYGALAYNRARAAGHGRLTSGLIGEAMGTLDNMTYGAGSTAEYVAQRTARKKKKNS